MILQGLQLCLPTLDFPPEVIFHRGETLHWGSVRTKILLGPPQHYQFSVVDFQEAGLDTEKQEALSLTGWIVIPWTLSAILRCVKKLVLRESWAPENGERGIGKT